MKRLVLIAGFAVSCATAPKASLTVLERSDEASSRPGWASFDVPVSIIEGKIYFTSNVTVSGSPSKSALMNMADEKAFSEPMRAIVDEFLDQNQVAEELNSDVNLSQRIISATRGYRAAMPSAHVVNRYWESVIVTLPDGSFRTETRGFSRVSIDIGDYERAKRDTLARLHKSPAIKDLLQEVGSKQIEKVLNQ